MKGLTGIFISWIPLGIVIVGLCGLISVTVQQNYRMSLNDPQIQMAQDAATAISRGVSVSMVVPSVSIDIATSLAPFVIVYDDTGKPVAYSGTISGAVPVPPKDVFSYANEHGSDRLSWEPQPGIRTAIDVERIPGNSGYVLVGRNMREVEARESDLTMIVGLGMIVLLLATFIANVFAQSPIAKKIS